MIRAAVAIATLSLPLSVARAAYRAVDLAPGDPTLAYGVDNGIEAGGETSAGNALLWSGSAASEIILPPGTGTGALARAISGNSVGGQQLVSGSIHAALWSGSAHAFTDLHPDATWSSSRVYAVGGAYQVGVATALSTGNTHAFVWNGTAASALDLTPAGYSTSQANAINGDTIVGYATSGPTTHAFGWSAATGQSQEITPVGYTSAHANGIFGTQVVGSAGGNALMWEYGITVPTLLTPSAATAAAANATNGTMQVGSATINGVMHAIAWNSSADNFIDLQLLLPPGYVSSEALGIDALGNIVGDATDAQLQQHAILWTTAAVPEPAALLTLAPALLIFGRRRRPR